MQDADVAWIRRYDSCITSKVRILPVSADKEHRIFWLRIEKLLHVCEAYILC